MSISKDKKLEIINNFGKSDIDSGSPNVQVAILSYYLFYWISFFGLRLEFSAGLGSSISFCMALLYYP